MDEMNVMTYDEHLAWVMGELDYIWTADDWAIHTVAEAMNITGFDALRLHRLRCH